MKFKVNYIDGQDNATKQYFRKEGPDETVGRS